MQIRITGSVCHSLLTYSKNKKPNWVNKFEKTFLSPFQGNSSTKYGQTHEKFALKLFANAVGDEGRVIPAIGFFIDYQQPWLGFSADGLYKTKSSLILLEVKCPVKGASIKTKEELLSTLKYLTKDLKLKKKHCYYSQIQLGMYLLNLRAAKLLILWKKKKSDCN